jgi:cell division protein FtsB
MSSVGSNTSFLRLLIAGLLVLLVVLQIRLWFSEDGYREVSRLQDEVAAQRLENTRLQERNARLEADVLDLKSGNSAIEERARADLGMVEEQEDFFLFGSDPDRPAQQAPK